MSAIELWSLDSKFTLFYCPVKINLGLLSRFVFALVDAVSVEGAEETLQEIKGLGILVLVHLSDKQFLVAYLAF